MRQIEMFITNINDPLFVITLLSSTVNSVLFTKGKLTVVFTMFTQRAGFQNDSTDQQCELQTVSPCAQIINKNNINIFSTDTDLATR